MTQLERDDIEAPIALPGGGEDEQAVAAAEERTGFLPIQTNWFDRVFISVMIWVALSLFWFRFMEPAGLSIWISNAIALILGFVIVRKG